jgi:hypothetical protein
MKAGMASCERLRVRFVVVPDTLTILPMDISTVKRGRWARVLAVRRKNPRDKQASNSV